MRMPVSSISNVSSPAAATQLKPATTRAPDGDTPAQEAAESSATVQAEKQGGGYAPRSSGAVDIKA